MTAGADSCIKVLDILRGFEERVVMNSTGAVLCAEMVDELCLVGCADGNILVYDLN